MDAARRTLVAGLLAAATLPGQAQVSDGADAVNKAGRLRMLSQRVVKAWLARAQGVEASRAERALAESVALFDRHLAELRAYAPNAEIRASYQRLEAPWGELRSALSATGAALASAPALLAQDAQVLALAHQATLQLESWSGRPTGHLIALAGRQRMLSQRMAKFRLLGSDAARTQVAGARAEFERALVQLEQAPESGGAIRAELVLARGQWVFFDHALQHDGALSPREAAEVFVASENILQVMDHVTGLYARLGA